MGYKDRDKQREYQRKWIASRREAYLIKRGPCAKRGSTTNLELDHVDPTQKVNHRIWSWSRPRLEAELEKCKILCRDCHSDKSYQGSEGPYDHPPSLVEDVRRLSREGLSTRAIASTLGVPKSSVWYIVSDKSYKNML